MFDKSTQVFLFVGLLIVLSLSLFCILRQMFSLFIIFILTISWQYYLTFVMSLNCFLPTTFISVQRVDKQKESLLPSVLQILCCFPENTISNLKSNATKIVTLSETKISEKCLETLENFRLLLLSLCENFECCLRKN